MTEEGKITAAQTQQPQDHRPKTGIGGCLLYPLLFLIAQPFLFAYTLCTASDPGPMMETRILWHYMIYDLVLLAAVAILLSLFVRKKAVLPAMFVLFLITFSILSGVLTNIVWRFPNMGGDRLLSHFIVLFQCLLLVPFFALDVRTKNTFIHELDEHNLVDQLVKTVAGPAERLYSWLADQGKRVFLYAITFVILVVLFDWLVDSIVLYVFLE